MNSRKDSLKFAASLLGLMALVAGALLLTRIPRGGTNRLAEVRSEQVDSKADAAVSVQTISQEQDSRIRESSAVKVSLKTLFSASTSKKNQHFEPHSVAEVNRFAELLRLELDGQAHSDDWFAQGWVVYRNVLPNSFVIAEHKSRRVGRGLYVVRTGRAVPIMLQAPHRFFDQKTGVITRKLFEERAIRAAAWNTMHRRKFDVAHETNSFFNAFTTVITERYPGAVNVQLHGFDNSDTKNIAGNDKAALAIVSNATRFPDARTKRLTRALKSNWGRDRVWLFPHETRELGATTNTQAALMRKSGNENFIHIELAKEVRDELAKSKRKRAELLNVLNSSIQ